MSRYSRQARFAPIGEHGQAKLRDATVLIVGAGALGAHMAEAMVRAGTGTVRIVDRDVVELSNLARQVLYTDADAKAHLPKAQAAAAALRRINPDVTVEPTIADVSPENAYELAAGVDLILDGTDNFETRFLINDLAVATETPWIYTGAVGAQAVSMPIIPGETACLACILETPPPPGAGLETCETVGVISPAVALAAALSLAEAFKLLVGDRTALRRSLVYHDVWQNARQEITTGKPRTGCEACDRRAGTYLTTTERGTQAVVMCGRDTVQISPPAGTPGLDLAALADRVEADAVVSHTPFTLRLAIDGHALTVFRDGRTLVHDTQDAARARALYARLMGG